MCGCFAIRTLISACVKFASFGNAGGAAPPAERNRHEQSGGEKDDGKDTTHRRIIGSPGHSTVAVA